jgi:transcriptional regulator with XRE-family HTH domain
VRPNGTTIRSIRELQKLSVRGLARRAGCDYSHLSRLERGKAGASRDTTQRIATALGVPVDAIATPDEGDVT